MDVDVDVNVDYKVTFFCLGRLLHLCVFYFETKVCNKHPRIPWGDSARYIDVASGITPGYPRMCNKCLVKKSCFV